MSKNDVSNQRHDLIRLKNLQNKRSQIFVRYTQNRLKIQRIIAKLLLFPFCGSIILIFKFFLKYEVRNIKSIRKQFKNIIKEKKPLIICSNHLTFIDSCIIIWALAPLYWYQIHFNYFSWNLPAGDFFGKKQRYRFIAFLSKCIFIHRDASASHHNEILDICKKLLHLGEVITIFPEGKRSRTGYFDPNQMTYGVGKIIQHVPNCRVLCIYVRSDKQENYSNYPVKKSSFYMKLQLLEPKTDHKGKEGTAEIVKQIAQVIKSQELEYFFQYKSGVPKYNEYIQIDS